MIVCETWEDSRAAKRMFGIDSESLFGPICGSRWQTIICPERLRHSDSEVERLAREAWLDDLKLKLRPGGQIIWI
jgi:hypothetical protein